MSVIALILAGGMGSRMGRPKQFLELLGQPALLHTLRAFQETPGVDLIHAVGDRGRIETLAKKAGITKYDGCAKPGESRSFSAKSGLALCEEKGPEAVILIHDGSRCLVTPTLIQRVVDAALSDEADGVIPTLPVSDTIKVCENGSVMKTLDRSTLHATQTPQAFRLGRIRQIYEDSEDTLLSATDDASLVERNGGRVMTVMGEKTNIKLTSPEDLILAEAILTARARAFAGYHLFGRSRFPK